MNVLLDKLIGAALLLLIVFTVLAHGTVEPWSVAVFELTTLLLTFIFVLKIVFEGRAELRIPAAAYPLVAFLVLGLIQSVAVFDDDGSVNSLSLDFAATRNAVQILFFLLLTHIIAANYFVTRQRLKTLTGFLTIFGLLLAVFALIQHLTWNNSFYWFRPSTAPGVGAVTGPFVNHSHFAGYINLLVPIPIALVITRTVKNTGILYGFAGIIMAVAVVASLSRGAIISLAVGLFYLLIRVVFLHRAEQAKSAVGIDKPLSANSNFAGVIGSVVIIGAILTGVVWLGFEPVHNRIIGNSVLSADESAQTFDESRGELWRNSWNVFRRHPITGVGLGAYPTAFPQHSENDMLGYGRTLVVDRVHNDYLQVLTDTGVVGGAIGIWFVIVVFFDTIRALHAPNKASAGFALGISASLLAIMIHSFFDFNLQFPGTALLFLVLTAVLSNIAVTITDGSENVVSKR